jgi:multiple sugar transport system substrate-binding protein
MLVVDAHRGGITMRGRVIVLAVVLILAPFGAQAADLVVWWNEGFYPQEDEAVRETIAAFEQDSGKHVELVFYEQAELPEKLKTALAAGRPPDFAFGSVMSNYISEWAFDDRLVDLTDTVGHFSDLFDPDALNWFVLLNRKTGQRALYALPWGRSTNHVHVWKSLLEQGGTLEDIPKEWSAFWSFWCDQVSAGGAPRDRSRRPLGRRPPTCRARPPILRNSSFSSWPLTMPTT